MKQVKKLFILLIVGIISVNVLYAQQCDDLYTEGVVLMKDKKQYREAIAKFQAASECYKDNTELKKLCADRIKECRAFITPTSANKNFSVNKQSIRVSADGGNDNVVVSNGKTWTVTSSEDWCKVQQSNNRFSVICLPNESVLERKAIVSVISENGENQYTEIVQAAGLERLMVSTADIIFVASGNEIIIGVTSNTEWSYSGIPSWCEVKREGNQLKIKANPNNTAKERTSSLLVSSRTKDQPIQILQHSNNEELAVSTSLLKFGYLGGSNEIGVYDRTNDWKIEKFPEWCMVTKKTDNTLLVECLKNNSTKPLEETILIRSGNNQQVGIKVRQDAGVPDNPIPISIIHGGKNVCFGVSVGIISPSFSISSSSDYLASAVNYAYDAEIEKARYSSGIGYTIGLIADIRLVNNFYLQSGVNFTTFSMENKFKGEYTDEMEMTTTTYLEGTAYDNFTDKYSLSYLEIPFLISYRYKLSENVNWQLNMGPYVGYGISGKGKVTGSTDWPSMAEYYYSNNNPTGKNYELNCEINGEFDLFGTTGNRKDSYTTGEMPTYEHEYEFDSSPFKKLNTGISLGTSFEFSGFNIGVQYDMGLNNIANEDYWTSTRFTISDYTGTLRMKDYKHKINRLQIKMAYIFR